MFRSLLDENRVWCCESRDYVNETKRSKICRSRVSPRGLSSVGPASPPLLSLTFSLCRMSDPVSAAPLHGWRGMKASDTNKTQTKTLAVPCAGLRAKTRTLSLFLLHSPCASFSRFHSLTVQTKRQHSAWHKQLTLSLLSHLPYHLCTKQRAFRGFCRTK